MSRGRKLRRQRACKESFLTLNPLRKLREDSHWTARSQQRCRDRLGVYFSASYLGLLLKYLKRPMIPAVRPPYTMPTSTPAMTRSIREYDARLNTMVISVIVNANNAHVNKEYRCHGGGPSSCDFVRLVADMGTSRVDVIGGAQA